MRLEGVKRWCVEAGLDRRVAASDRLGQRKPFLLAGLALLAATVVAAAAVTAPVHFAAAFWLVGALAIAAAWAIHRHVPEGVVEIRRAGERNDQPARPTCQEERR